MSQSCEQEGRPNTSEVIRNKIKQLLQKQRFAVHRTASIGMTRDEAKEMEASIDEIGELVERLSDLSQINREPKAGGAG
jgi:Arc/MetJ-type ribon-helix-helix transcriptional regulator